MPTLCWDAFLLAVILVCVEICNNPSLFSQPEKLLKSPVIAKTFNTPLPSGRKAFGTVNTISTPAVNAQERKLMKKQVRTSKDLQK